MIFSLFLVADSTESAKQQLFLGADQSALKESYWHFDPKYKKANQRETQQHVFIEAIASWTDEQKESVTDNYFYSNHDGKGVSPAFKQTREYQTLENFGLYITEPFENTDRRGHYHETYTHRQTIRKVYDSCPENFPHVTEKQLALHDLSKYDFLESVGYQFQFARGETGFLPENAPEEYRRLAGITRGKDNGGNTKGTPERGYDYFEAGLEHHYENNAHHPEYHNGRSMMFEGSPMYLEEMVIDMIAAVWERVGSKHDTVHAFLTATKESSPPFPFWNNGWNNENPNFFSSKNVAEDKVFVNELVDRLRNTKCGA